MLGLEDRGRWIQLELVWTMQNRRMWEATGQATSVFQLADTGPGAETLLEAHPSLLLSVRKEELHLTNRGVWVLGQYLAARPDDRDIMWEWSVAEHAYIVEIGSHRLRTAHKPRDLVVSLKTWLHFYFIEFLPRLPAARRPASTAAQSMWHGLRAAAPSAAAAWCRAWAT